MAYNKGFYGKRNKFGAKKTEFMGMKFDSKWEAERYGQLYLKFERGEIEELDRQIRFNILVNDQKICAYVADYTYYETDENGERQYIVEDAKGVETPEFKLKKKLMLAANGIDIRISKK
tara:strand:+ start:25 stop:381 length:357 start_codon:yes stop_codon:yes gene_type:complete